MTKSTQFLFYFLLQILLVFPIILFAQIETLHFEKEISTDTNSIPTKKETQQKTKVNDFIHFGDLIDIDILGSVEYDWRGKITPEGFLTGANFSDEEIDAACHTIGNVARQIEKSYGKFLKNPKVIVTILDKTNRANAIVFGAIKQPLRFKLKRSVKLSELLVRTGGFTENASGQIRILRQPNASCAARLGATQLTKQNEMSDEFIKIKQDVGARVFTIEVIDLLKGKKEANPEIFYGDIITVRKAEPIYIIGGVENPSKISLRSDMTVSRAIASAGGLTKRADPQDITIFRRGNGETLVIKTDLEKIVKDKNADIKLKAFDVVEVGGKGARKRKYPPVFRFTDKNVDISKLPMRIID